MRALFWLAVAGVVVLAVAEVISPAERFNGRAFLGLVLAGLVVLNLRAVEA